MFLGMVFKMGREDERKGRRVSEMWRFCIGERTVELRAKGDGKEATQASRVGRIFPSVAKHRMGVKANYKSAQIR